MPFAAGNTLDIALRQVAEVYLRNTGQLVLVDNRPGGAGFIAAQAVAQAAPDGLTLLLGNSSMLTINPHIFANLPYDPEKSFRPLTNFLGASLVLAVNAATVRADSLAEFIAWAKPQGAKVSYASFTAGNASHFAGVILNKRAGLERVHVPFNGTPPAVQNLVGGHVQGAFLPLLAPAGTPDAVIARLHTELTKVIASREIRDKWRALDFDALPSSPEESARFARAESRRWAEAVRLSGFKASE